MTKQEELDRLTEENAPKGKLFYDGYILGKQQALSIALKEIDDKIYLIKSEYPECGNAVGMLEELKSRLEKALNCPLHDKSTAGEAFNCPQTKSIVGKKDLDNPCNLTSTIPMEHDKVKTGDSLFGKRKK